jgi:hypothetical protein
MGNAAAWVGLAFAVAFFGGLGGYALYHAFIKEKEIAYVQYSEKVGGSSESSQTQLPSGGGERLELDNIPEGQLVVASCSVPTQYPEFQVLNYGSGTNINSDATKANTFCVGKNPCQFLANNEFLGPDPKPGSQKWFKGTYFCRNPPAKT